MMTDQQLIELVRSSPAAELTAEQIGWLRQRWRASPELRAALADHLELETGLAEALGSVDLTVDLILQRAEHKAPNWKQRLSSPWPWGAAILLLALAGWGWSTWNSAPLPEPLAGTAPAVKTDALETAAATPIGDRSGDQQPVEQAMSGQPAAEPDSATGPDSLLANQGSPGTSRTTPGDEAGAGQSAAPATQASDQRAAELAAVRAAITRRDLQLTADPTDPWYAVVTGRDVPWSENSWKWQGDLFSLGSDEFPESAFRQWLMPVAGKAFALGQDQHSQKRCSRFQGMARLKAPWRSDAAWRLAPFDVQDLKLTFWSGQTGVLLRFYPHRYPQIWAGYQLTRERLDEPRPEKFDFIAGDHGATHRSYNSSIDVFWQDGWLCLVRGGCPLVRVPLASPPDEAYLEGQFRLRACSLVRMEPWTEIETSPETAAAAAIRTGTSSLATKRLRIEVGTETDGTWQRLPRTNPQADASAEPESPTKLTVHGPGHLELRGVHGDQELLAWRQLPDDLGQLLDLQFHLGEATPGTGVYLGDRQGTPLIRVAYVKEDSTGEPAWRLYHTWQRQDHDQVDPSNNLAGWCSLKRAWLRLRVVGGLAQLWVSADGRTWSRHPDQPLQTNSLDAPIATYGLFGIGGGAEKRIEVRDWSIESSPDWLELASLPAGSNGERAQDFEFPRWTDGARRDRSLWVAEALRAKPVTVDARDWLAACVVSVFSKGCSPDLAGALLEHLAEHLAATDRLIPLGGQASETMEGEENRAVNVALPQSSERQAQQLARLHHVVAAMTFPDEGRLKRIASLYERLAIAAVRYHSPRDVAAVRRAWLAAPIWSGHNLTASLQEPNRQTLFSALARQDWPALQSAAETLLFWARPVHPDHRPGELEPTLRLAAWARRLAADQLGAGETETDRSITQIPTAGRTTVTVPTDKDLFNFMAELESALDSQSLGDACRVLVSLGQNGDGGLFPDRRDPDLARSLTLAVEQLVRSQPAFQQRLNEEHGRLAQLQVQQAMTRGELQTVELATLRYLGTPAARTAHRWLGEQALAAGNWTKARSHFLQALNSSGLGAAARVHLRLTDPAQLPAADREVWEQVMLVDGLAGGTIAELSTQNEQVTTVTAGSAQSANSPAAWQQVVRSRLSAEYGGVIGDLMATRQSPPVTGYANAPTRRAPATTAIGTATARFAFDGQSGQNPGRPEYRGGDWCQSQLSLLGGTELPSIGPLLLVHNRFQVSAVDPSNWQTRWAVGLAGEQGETHAFAGQPMHPLIVGQTVYVRRLLNSRTELTALNATNGSILWSWNAGDRCWIVTDPIWQGDQLLVATTTDHEQSPVVLELNWIDPQRGVATRTSTGFRVADQWQGRIPATMISLGDVGSLLQLPGALIRLNDQGLPVWLRRSSVLPELLDPRRFDAPVNRPQLVDDTLLSIVPGSHTLLACHWASGERLWRVQRPDLIEMLGVANGLVIVRAENSLVAWELASGQFRWEQPFRRPILSAVLQLPNLFVVTREERGQHRTLPLVHRLDSATGANQGTGLLDVGESEELQFGPWFTLGERLLVGVGRNPRDARREFFEVGPEEPPAPRDSASTTSSGLAAAWGPRFSNWSPLDVARLLPGWQILGDHHDQLDFPTHDVQGEKRLVLTRGNEGRPVEFHRSCQVPASGASRLALRIGHHPGQKWDCEVRVNGQPVEQIAVDDASAAGGWRDASVDLTRFAGETVWVTLAHVTRDHQPADAFWKSARVVTD